MLPQLDLAREVLAAQPFSRLLGAEITEFSEFGFELRLAITPQLLQQDGFVHGGVLSYVADNAITFAGGGALGPAVVTSEYKISYLRPAKGDTLVARATVVHAGRNQAVCDCEVFCVEEGNARLCAVALGTVSARAKSPS